MNNNTTPPAMEWPDKRAWIFLAPLLLAMLAWGIAWAFLPTENAYSRPLELGMYSLLVAFGICLGGMGLLEGRSLMRPSIQKEQEPLLFKLEIWGTCFGSAIFGIYMLIDILST